MNRDVLEFVTFCVGALALKLNMSRGEVYTLLSKAGLMKEYIVECYDVLHTFSRSYILDDLTELMRERGVIR